jgi:RNA polymerase sigma-70 factor (ECF subfamily)
VGPAPDRLATLGRPFPSTRWSLIHDCRDSSKPDFRTQLGELVERYWPPAYWFIRRHWGKSREEAKDLCQEFFLQFYEKDYMQSVDADRGRFRSFVCGALRRFLCREHRDASRLKRKPAEGFVLSMEVMGSEDDSFDVEDQRPGLEDLEEAFRARWKKSVVHNALARMRRSATEREKSVQVEVFARYRIEHDAGQKPTRIELAEVFGITLNQVLYALQWGDKEFVQALREELLDQVSTEKDFHAEARELFGF